MTTFHMPRQSLAIALLLSSLLSCTDSNNSTADTELSENDTVEPYIEMIDETPDSTELVDFLKAFSLKKLLSAPSSFLFDTTVVVYSKSSRLQIKKGHLFRPMQLQQPRLYRPVFI